eukprot:PhF_6_TR30581/c0_g1_i1/m.44962
MNHFCALLVFGLSAFLHVIASQPLTTYWKYNSTTGTVLPSPDPTQADISSYFNDVMDTTGWTGLKITRLSGSTLNRTDPLLWYTAGYAEGHDTAKRIQQNYRNIVEYYNKTINENKHGHKVWDWLAAHLKFMETEAVQNEGDIFWTHVNCILHQIRGLADGYRNTPYYHGYNLKKFDLFVLSFQTELTGDLMKLLSLSSNKDDESLFMPTDTKCSAFVRMTSSTKDLCVAHTTWGSYSSMLRVFKDYDFGMTRVAFSGYPGMVHSDDDWYITSTMTILETTLDVFNKSLYRDFMVPHSVSEFIRVMAANQIAQQASEWGSVFCRLNSGTYNNQWMAVDMATGNLFVAEQLPGYCVHANKTDTLTSQSYWASYNLPAFEEIYVVSGTQKMYNEYGDFFSPTKYSRGEIFARELPNVETMEDAQRLIRYNNYQSDPFSLCPNCNPKSSPELTIANRADLVPANGTWGNWTWLKGPKASGAIDGKIICRSWGPWNGRIISGPTWDDQTAFVWSTSSVANLPKPHSYRHGQPDNFKFPWINTTSLF